MSFDLRSVGFPAVECTSLKETVLVTFPLAVTKHQQEQLEERSVWFGSCLEPAVHHGEGGSWSLCSCSQETMGVCLLQQSGVSLTSGKLI